MWRSFLLVEDTRVLGENHQPVASHCQTLSHNVVSSTPCHERIQTHNFSFENMYDACTCIALLTKYIAEFKFRKKIPCLTVYLMFHL
jgi:hypothetical protein